jgi:hypothetical protein
MLMCSFVYAQKPKTSPKAKPKTVTPAVIAMPLDTVTSKVIPNTDTLSGEFIGEEEKDTTEVRLAKSALKTKVKYSAKDSIIYNALTQEVFLYGKAKVIYDDLTLDADFIKIELSKTLVHATGIVDSFGFLHGTPVFNQGGTEYKVQRVSYNYKSKKGYLSELRTKEGEGYVKGTDVIRSPDNEFGIRESYYTTCDLDTPHFHIQAARLKIIPDKKIITGSANLRIEGMPTPLVVPFGIFSIKKGQSSGIIIPTYGSSMNRGFFLRGGGYYFGMGEKADYMVTGDIYTQGSWALNNLIRYNNRYRFNGQLGVNFANNKFGAIDDPTFYQSKDFRVNWIHNVDPKARPGTYFGANVNFVSGSYLANNSYVAQNVISNQILSSINYSRSFSGGKYNLTSSASLSQNLQTRQLNVALPNVTFTVSSFSPFKAKSKPTADKWYENITTNYTMNFRNEINTYDSLLFSDRKRSEFASFYDTAGRYGIQHSLPVQTSFKILKYYTLSAGVQLNEVWYMQSVNKSYNSGLVATESQAGFVRAFTYQPRVGLNTRIYGMKTFNGNTVKAIRHVVSPTVDFTYTPDFSDAAWGYYKSFQDTLGKITRYSIFERGIFGGPGSGSQGNVGFGIDNNLELKVMRGKDTARKEEKVQIFETFRIGSYYNLFADSLNLAPITLNARTKLFKNVTINANAVLDPYKNEITTGTTGFKSVTRTKDFYWNDNKLGAITNANLALSASFNPQTFKRNEGATAQKYANEWKYLNANPLDYYDFNIPWNLNVNYTIQYARYNNLNNPLTSNVVQTFNFSGDLNLTKNWKIAATSGYDLQTKEITFTTIDFVRDLHCWTFKLTWIPIGFRQSFFFQINVRSSVLQDLKLTRRREWFDRAL